MEGDGIQESWVELHFNGSSGSGLPSLQASADNAALERLLLEAQESCPSSRTASKGSSPPGSYAARSPPVFVESETVSVPESSGVRHSVAEPASVLSQEHMQQPARISADHGFIQEPAQPDTRSNTDWIWDWSSRPERSNGSGRAPAATMATNGSGTTPRNCPPRRGLSVRRSALMKRNFMATLPGYLGPDGSLTALLISHAASFLLGAAAMLIFLKKYCRWTATSVQVPLD